MSTAGAIVGRLKFSINAGKPEVTSATGDLGGIDPAMLAAAALRMLSKTLSSSPP